MWLEPTSVKETVAAMERARISQPVRFNKFNVSNGVHTARIFYSLDNRVDGRKCVTLYAKDYGHALRNILGSCYSNSTDLDSDVHDQGKAVLFENHPLYKAARTRAEVK